MAKRSRRPNTSRPGAPPAPTEPSTAPRPDDAAVATASVTSTRRSTRSPRARRALQSESPFERYRGLILGGVAIVGILIIGFLFFQSSGGAAYACEVQLTPGPVESVTPRPPTPTPGLSASPSPDASASPGASGSPAASGTPSASGTPGSSGTPTASGTPGASETPGASASPTAAPTPEPEPTARLGFTTTILGANHVPVNEPISFGFCPPTSGDHYNSSGRGPIRAAVYPPSAEQAPGGWVHNLEHGWIVLAYRCPGGAIGAEGCPTTEENALMQQILTEAPVVNNCPKQIAVVRFDEMDTRFALLAWGRALLTNELDLDTALTFAQQWTDAFAPENTTC